MAEIIETVTASLGTSIRNNSAKQARSPLSSVPTNQSPPFIGLYLYKVYLSPQTITDLIIRKRVYFPILRWWWWCVSKLPRYLTTGEIEAAGKIYSPCNVPMWKLQLGENPSKRGNLKSVTEWSPQEEYLLFSDDVMYTVDKVSPSSVIDFLSKNLIIISSLIFLYLHTSGRGKRGFNFMQILIFVQTRR